MFFSNKKKKLIITSEQVIFCKEKKNDIDKRYNIGDVVGITKSLIVASLSFIMHFNQQADVELRSEYRDDIISAIL